MWQQLNKYQQLRLGFYVLALLEYIASILSQCFLLPADTHLYQCLGHLLNSSLMNFWLYIRICGYRN